MNRRGFLASILAVGVAPFVVTSAGVLMPVRKRIVVASKAPIWTGAASAIKDELARQELLAVDEVLYKFWNDDHRLVPTQVWYKGMPV